jgi:hypothetical protein
LTLQIWRRINKIPHIAVGNAHIRKIDGRKTSSAKEHMKKGDREYIDVVVLGEGQTREKSKLLVGRTLQ